MGLLSNLWHGKGHEKFDQLALELAEATAESINKQLSDGVPTEVAAATAQDEAEEVVRQAFSAGMNMFGFARLMKSYADALVMLGLPRRSAIEMKKHLRRRITMADLH